MYYKKKKKKIIKFIYINYYNKIIINFIINNLKCFFLIIYNLFYNINLVFVLCINIAIIIFNVF